MTEEEKEAIKELIDSSNLSLIGDGTMIVKNTTIATILNLIDKLQKENREYKHTFAEMVQTREDNFTPKYKIKELKEKIHQELDNNGITRAYQITIDKYFDELLEE